MKLSKTLVSMIVLVVLWVYFGRFDASLIDDAYITLQYARNLAFHGTWGLLPGLTANTATSPLNVLVLSAASLILRNPSTAAVGLTALECFLIWLTLTQLARQLWGHPFAGWLAASGFAFNPLLNSTIGLESYLFILLFVAALLCFVKGRWKTLGLALGLLTLTRMEGALALPLFVLCAPDWKARLRVAGYWVVPTAPWLAFSWICLGGLVPDTLLIKTNQGAWGGNYRFANGLFLYLLVFRRATIWSLLFTLACIAAVRAWRGTARSVLLITTGFTALQYAGYSCLGVGPYHWYYMPLILGVTVCGAFGVGQWHQHRRDRLRSAPSIALTALIPSYALYMLGAITTSEDFRIAEVPIHTNWALPAEYKLVASKVKAIVPEDKTIWLEGEIGTFLYYSDRRMLETFSDRSRILDKINKARSAPGLRGLFARVNYYWLTTPQAQPPPSYLLLIKNQSDIRPGTVRPQDHHWVIRSRFDPRGYILLAPMPLGPH